MGVLFTAFRVVILPAYAVEKGIITVNDVLIDMWIHEHQSWLNFTWDARKLTSMLAEFLHRQGRLLGRMEGLDFELKREASLGVLTSNAVKSSGKTRTNE